MVGEVTGTSIGCRLRRIAVRLLLGAGLAGAAFLCCALLGAGTASAAQTPTTPTTGHSGHGLLGTLVGSVTTTLDGTLTVLDTTATTVVEPPPAAGPVTTPQPPAPPVATKPLPAKKTTAKHSITAVTARPATAPTRTKPAVSSRHAVTHAATATVRKAAPAARPVPAQPRSAGAGHHRPAPLPTPAPQYPSPAVPASSVSAGHDGAMTARHLVATAPSHSDLRSATGAGGWSADPAALAARSQGLPTTSPD